MAWIAGLLGAVVLAGGRDGWYFYGLALAAHLVSLSLVLGPFLGRLTLVRRVGVGLLAFFLLHYGVYGSVRYLAGGLVVPVELVELRSNPLLNSGDVLLYQGHFVRPQRFERGDLVMYNIRSQTGHGFRISAGTGLDRIIGLPGDTVSVKGGQLWINGQPTDLLPVAGLDYIPPNLSIQAGPNEYIILPSLMSFLNPGGHGDMLSMYIHASRVAGEDILGKAYWRLRPLHRFGPLERR